MATAAGVMLWQGGATPRVLYLRHDDVAPSYWHLAAVWSMVDEARLNGYLGAYILQSKNNLGIIEYADKIIVECLDGTFCFKDKSNSFLVKGEPYHGVIPYYIKFLDSPKKCKRL